MDLLKLVRLGPQDAYLTGNPAVTLFRIQTRWREFEEEFGSYEGVRALEERHHQLTWNAISVRWLVCEAHVSTDSPFYGMDPGLFKRILQDLTVQQHQEIAAVKERLDRANRLMTKLSQLNEEIALHKPTPPGPSEGAAACA